MKQKINIKPYDCVVLMLLVFFFCGYFGLFSFLSEYISKLVIYLSLLVVWLVVMRDYVISGVKRFRKEYFNEALSIVLILGIVSAILFLPINRIFPDNNLLQNKITPLAMFSALIFASIVEELVNRCAMGLVLEKIIKHDLIINVVTAAIFAFMHTYKMDFSLGILLVYAVIYFVLGYVLGHYYRKTNNIVLAMLIHFSWNLFMIIGLVLRNIF